MIIITAINVIVKKTSIFLNSLLKNDNKWDNQNMIRKPKNDENLSNFEIRKF